MHVSRQKIKCGKCDKDISKPNFKKHYQSCTGISDNHIKEEWFDGNYYKCPHCNKGFGKKGIFTHIWRNHTEEGKTHSLVKRPAREWHISWNRGLTKENDLRVLHNSINAKQAKINNGTLNLGHPHTEEAKRKISEKLSINNKGGRSKWYEVSGQKVQGTWERNIALKLDEMNISWKKLKTNRDILKYVMDGKERSYTPDFYLKDYNIFLEIKGYWWGNDREKMDIVLETHKDKNIVIIEKEQYEKILQGELVW